MFLLTASLWDPTASQDQRRTRQDGGWGRGWICASAQLLLLCDLSGPLFLLCEWDSSIPCSACPHPPGFPGIQGLLRPCSSPAQSVGCQGRICQNEVKTAHLGGWASSVSPVLRQFWEVLRRIGKGAVGAEKRVQGGS